MIVHRFTDNKTRALVTVHKEGRNTGILVVTSSKGRLLGTAGVGIAFGAQFGPDVADIQDWERAAVLIIDNKRSGPSVTEEIMAMRVGFEMRGNYEDAEQRILLHQRPMGGTWTPFESQLFNLVTTGYDRGVVGAKPRLFSKRLAAVNAALAAIDLEMTKGENGE